MPLRTYVLGFLFLARGLNAQQPAPNDTTPSPARADTGRTVALPSVTISVQRVRRDQPVSAVTVGAAQIAQTPALNPWDLLRQTAGVEVHDQGQGPGFASDASLRGFSSDHSTDLALWIDGVPVNEPVNGHAEGYGDWSVLMPQAVQDMDVIKGPGSALFGNFALAGVVNVRTLERVDGTRAWASGGSFGRGEGALITGWNGDAQHAVIAVRGLREGGWRPNSGYDLGQGHLRFVRDLSPIATLDAGVELYGSRWDSPGFLSLEQFDANDFDAVANPTDGGFKRRAQERVSLRVAARSFLWRTTLYSTQGRWQLFLTTPPEGGSGEGTGSQTEEEDRRHGFGATSALTWTLSHGEVTVGGEGRLDHSDYQNWLTTNRERDEAQDLVVARQLSGAAFVQAEERAGPLRLHLGGRYDRLATRSTTEEDGTVSGNQGIFSPKLGAYLGVGRGLGLYAGAYRGFRSTDGVITDPSLPLITAWAYEGGVKVDRRRFAASAALFRMDVSNEQTFDPIRAVSTSGGASRRQGVELEMDARPSPAVTVTGDWTFNDAHYTRLITEEGDTLSGARVFNTARWIGAAAVQLAPPMRPWRLRLAGNFVGPYTPFDEPGVELASYGLLHGTAGYAWRGALLEVGVRNLLDRKYPELRAGGFVSPGQARTVIASVSYAF
jgi:outer membrane receptor protein involved in Fe transport